MNLFLLQKNKIKRKKKKKSKAKETKKKEIKQEQKQQENIKEKNEKIQTPTKQINQQINVVGILISYIKDNVIIKKYCRESIVFLIKDDECEEVNSKTENVNVRSFDYIVAIKYMAKYKMVRVSKISIEEEKLIQDINDCKFVNEIYKIPIHETVLENAKNQLARV